MAMPITVNVKVTGGLFKRNIPQTARDALVGETLDTIHKRLMRNGRFGSGGKGRGVRRNTVDYFVDYDRGTPFALEISSTLNPPRTKGTKWLRKNVAITKAMAPRVLRKAAQRMVSDLSRA